MSAPAEAEASNAAALPHPIAFPDLAPFRGLRVVDLSGRGLTHVPAAICELGQQTEVLNLASNALCSLPPELGRLRGLRTLGLRSNALTSLPDELGDLQQLESLFLTDNKLTSLPPSLGLLRKLRKLQAASNALTSLPAELAGAESLELLRVPCNALASLPAALASHPRLCWLSLAGNAAWCAPPQPAAPVPVVEAHELELTDGAATLGPAGASGGVYPATWRGKPVALKRFVAGVSPDGAPEDEVAAACAVRHAGCVRVLALQRSPTLAMVMAPAAGTPLGGRPNAASLLRCTYPPEQRWSSAFALRCARDVSGALAACHAARLAHGDVYAHNIVVDERGAATLVDMGAAFAYPQVRSY